MRIHADHGCRPQRPAGTFRALVLVILAPALAGVAGPIQAVEPSARAAGAPHARVDFERVIRPILSENCFACHGFDAGKRQATLRLDVREDASRRLPSGHTAIVPGHPEASELVRRVAGHSMPPDYSGKRLTAQQITLLRQWVEQGAPYAQHWAFVRPKRPPLPAVKIKNWPINPIDRFVLARLEQEGLQPSPEADRSTLIRRLSLDLTGLPPTIDEVRRFLADREPGAYERLVDRLLSSPHYGERMALAWLDLARYADTHGYHIDSQRDMWLWRNWVIDAFNRNIPYDQFTIEQIAGDLLPHPTIEQKIATGFNRNHPINFEGGAIPEEYQAAYLFDRVDTTATAFMGLTLRCGQCHDHKYDPLTQREYYRFLAFFNNVPEQGLDGQKGNAKPFLKVPSPEQQQQLESYSQKIAGLEQSLKGRAAEAGQALAAWEKNTIASLETTPPVSAGLVAHYSLDETSGDQVRATLPRELGTGRRGLGKPPASSVQVISSSAHQLTTEPNAPPTGTIHGKPGWTRGKVGGALSFDGDTFVDLGTSFGFDRTDQVSYGAWIYPTSKEAMTVLSRMDDDSAFRGWDLYLNDGKAYVHLVHQWEVNAIRVNTKGAIEPNQWHHLFVTYDGSSKAKGVKLYIDGKPAELEITHDKLTDTIQTPKPLLIGRRSPSAPFRGTIDEVRIFRRVLTAAEVAQLAGLDTLRPILAAPADQRTREQKEALVQYFLDNQDEPYRRLTAALSDSRKKQTELDNAIPTTMVMEEMEKPRDTFILIRGQYDRKGEKVTPGTPAALPPMPTGAPLNRLGLARWLVDPAHPLTARVAINHFWQIDFGTGLVRTAENFGTQGEPPSHPELLDWLATEFVRTGWDVKAMQRLIVTSATYRQSSRVTTQLLAQDPENRLLARGPRFRLPAELVRDQALAVSGLLVPKIGGPSVRPYQPPGLWEEIAFGGGFSAQKYEQDHGEALYRRSLYTFWKRTCPPSSLQTFDAPEREFCMVRRSVTNTPLQALVLMNDPTYVEASRKFAERMMTEVAAMPADRIRFGFHVALCRPPTDAETRVLLSIYNEQLAQFRKDKDAAAKLLSVGESRRSERLDAAQLAAWATVASVILNLDETITKS